MSSTKYAKAMREVTEYLKGIRKEDLEKIPNDFLNFLNENEDKNYKCNFDYTRPLKELDLSDEAKGMILYITYNYWCKTDKKEFYDKLNENEKIFQEQLRVKFNNTSKSYLNDNMYNKEKDTDGKADK